MSEELERSCGNRGSYGCIVKDIRASAARLRFAPIASVTVYLRDGAEEVVTGAARITAVLTAIVQDERELGAKVMFREESAASFLKEIAAARLFLEQAGRGAGLEHTTYRTVKYALRAGQRMYGCKLAFESRSSSRSSAGVTTVFVCFQEICGHPVRIDDAFQLRNFMKCMERTLQVLHAHGYAHGDIKPANIVQCGGGRFKLIDYGNLTTPTDAPRHVVRSTTVGFVHPSFEAHLPYTQRRPYRALNRARVESLKESLKVMCSSLPELRSLWTLWRSYLNAWPSHAMEPADLASYDKFALAVTLLELVVKGRVARDVLRDPDSAGKLARVTEELLFQRRGSSSTRVASTVVGPGRTRLAARGTSSSASKPASTRSRFHQTASIRSSPSQTASIRSSRSTAAAGPGRTRRATTTRGTSSGASKTAFHQTATLRSSRSSDTTLSRGRY